MNQHTKEPLKLGNWFFGTRRVQTSFFSHQRYINWRHLPDYEVSEARINSDIDLEPETYKFLSRAAGASFTKPCALLKLDFLTSAYKKCMR